MDANAISALSMIGFMLAALYCVVNVIRNVREKRYVWAAIGLLGALAIMLTPVQTHAVKIDLPAP